MEYGKGRMYVISAISTDPKTDGTRLYVSERRLDAHPFRAKLFTERHKGQVLRLVDHAKQNAHTLMLNPHTIKVQAVDWNVSDVIVADDPEWYAAVNESAFAKLNSVEIESFGLTSRALQQHIVVRSRDTDIFETDVEEPGESFVALAQETTMTLDKSPIRAAFRSAMSNDVHDEEVSRFVRFASTRGCFSYEGGNMVLNEPRARQVLVEFFKLRNISNGEAVATKIIDRLIAKPLSA